MFICRVTGTIVATRKHERFRAAKLLIVQPVDGRGNLTGRKDMLALDPKFGAGVGDLVLVAKEGAVVSQIMAADDVPANVVVLGVIDNWHQET